MNDVPQFRSAPVPKGVALALIGLALVGVIAAVAVYFTGVLQEWEGTYTGIVRSTGAPGGLAILKDPGGRGDVVLLLSAPDLKDGRCAIAFDRSGRRMEVHYDEKCGGPTGDHSTYASSMVLEGDSLSVTLHLIPGHLDFDHEVKFEFIGKRSSNPEARLPPLFPGTPPSQEATTPPVATAGDAAQTCYQTCLTCGLACRGFGGSDSAKEKECSSACIEEQEACCRGARRFPKSDECGCSDAPARSKGPKNSCLRAGMECRLACPKASPPKPGMTTAETAAYEAAMDTRKQCRADCARTEEGCNGAKPCSCAPGDPLCTCIQK